MKKIAITLIYIISIHTSMAQVGIGTITPTAELEIAASNTGIPALEINPQTAPVGTVTGQLAVIGDKLYMYDGTRSKWLSIESTALQYGYSGSSDGNYSMIGGNVGSSSSGAFLPFDATIIYVTVKSSGGSTSKKFYLYNNGSKIPTNTDPNLSGDFFLSGGTYALNTKNIDLNAGDYLSTRSSGSGSSVSNPVVIIWVKWRK